MTIKLILEKIEIEIIKIKQSIFEVNLIMSAKCQLVEKL